MIKKAPDHDWSEWLHVHHNNDVISHNLDFMGNDGCSCNPMLDLENHLIIHDSLDRIEKFEADQIVCPETNIRYSDFVGD